MTPTPTLATCPAARTRIEVSPRRFASTTPLRAHGRDFAVVRRVEGLMRIVFRVSVVEVCGNQQTMRRRRRA